MCELPAFQRICHRIGFNLHVLFKQIDFMNLSADGTFSKEKS
jgi:hypothetical protein